MLPIGSSDGFTAVLSGAHAKEAQRDAVAPLASPSGTRGPRTRGAATGHGVRVTSADGLLRPCVLIATESAERARRAAAMVGLEPRVVLSKADCARGLGDVRRAATRARIATTAVHSPDWQRQSLPQLFELAAIRLAVPETLVIGDDGELQLRRGRGGMMTRALVAPPEIVLGLALAGAEGMHFARARRRQSASRRPLGPLRGSTALVVWEGAPGTVVGGSVTHIAGVLGGFRAAGLRVHLLTACEPPAQLSTVVDELDVVPPTPPAARASNEVASICANRYGRRVALRHVERHRPAFIYQRYDPFVWYGVEAADRLAIPSVLEWNSSEVWTQANWHTYHPLKHLFDPLLKGVERHLVARATIVAAVSRPAAEMATAGGADPSRVVIVPNGVDVTAIDEALQGSREASSDGAPRVGWVGSFGTWHGAEVLVRALATLPAEFGAVLIGDGPRREACRTLAGELGVADRIEWTGALPHDEACRRLASCEVLASPHVQLEGGQAFFGSPTKLFEYMAIGRPIVASALEQIGEVLEDGRTARLVRPGDAADLARAIGEVIAMEDRGHSLGAAARREARAGHTWDERARSILAAISDGVGSPGLQQERIEV
jgi:glycosyltransferase involved in cell wall biosynthesis